MLYTGTYWAGVRLEQRCPTDIVFNILIFDDHKTLCNSLRNRRINNYDKLKENNFLNHF
jgi:hypothetical protein